MLFDYHAGIHVILPTPEGDRGVEIDALLPSALGQLVDSGGLSAVDRNLECVADLSHPCAAECTDPLDQHCG